MSRESILRPEHFASALALAHDEIERLREENHQLTAVVGSGEIRVRGVSEDVLLHVRQLCAQVRARRDVGRELLGRVEKIEAMIRSGSGRSAGSDGEQGKENA